jgi:hypothetical protein
MVDKRRRRMQAREYQDGVRRQFVVMRYCADQWLVAGRD